MKVLAFCLVLLTCAMGCGNSSQPSGTAEARADRVVTSSTDGKKKDNTAINERDRSTAAKTPLDQKENQKDIDITASIRKRVVDSKMSSNAQNSKIITQDGKVTLRGPVKSNDEKQQIEEIAIDVAGTGNVDNQLEVQP